VTGPKDPAGRDGRFFADVLSFGWVLPAAIAAGAGLGWFLDRLLGAFPVFTAALGLLGFAAGLRELLREANALSGDGPKDPGAGDGGGPGT
jgi:ATP synthase protein I